MRGEKILTALLCATLPWLSASYSPPNPKQVDPNMVGIGSNRRRSLFSLITGATFMLSSASGAADAEVIEPRFRRISTQFIAALGDPKATSGSGAQEWGLWTVDPGPRGVFLSDSKQLMKQGIGPYGWKFDPKDWWLEEHGLIMESPDFPLPAGKYLVTGGRETTTTLIVDEQGDWSLGKGTLYDVTHLPCRSARYTASDSNAPESQCSPARANPSNFPVKPGAVMPKVNGCNKQDYAVLFVIGLEEKMTEL